MSGVGTWRAIIGGVRLLFVCMGNICRARTAEALQSHFRRMRDSLRDRRVVVGA
jgi:hypothetical protein